MEERSATVVSIWSSNFGRSAFFSHLGRENSLTLRVSRTRLVMTMPDSCFPVEGAAELARISGTPPKFLEQVLRLLRKGGFIRSRRGSGGGYELAKPADRIMMDEVVQLIDGGMDPAVRSGDPFRVEWSKLKTESDHAAMEVLAKESLDKFSDRIRNSRFASHRGTNTRFKEDKNIQNAIYQ